MFDDLADSALLAEMAAAQRDERVAVARRLMAAGRLRQVRMSAVKADDRFQWCIDNWEAVAAEVGAELGISRGRASVQMNYGVELLERLPRLGAVFAAGTVDFRVIAAAVSRTGLITDPDILVRIDAALADGAAHWNRLSGKRLAELVEFWGALRAPDAAALEKTLDQLADAVCPGDPRTKDQCRADALVGLTGGTTQTLSCQCGAPACPAADATAAASVVIHILAESAALTGDSDKPGYLPGYGTVPPAMLRQYATSARLRPLDPAALCCPEARYRPSTALAEFIRCRDLHCRFPGCDKPAEYCDIDHTVPWQQGGLTHPSNLALLCRAHHLVKTFWMGHKDQKGWGEEQYSDGTIVWTSPSGRRYTTTPSGALFFPQSDLATADITLQEQRARQDSAGGPGRTLMMPTRRRTRAAERAARIQWERGLNEARWAADPPPF
jgi:hypothetical protein